MQYRKKPIFPNFARIKAQAQVTFKLPVYIKVWYILGYTKMNEVHVTSTRRKEKALTTYLETAV